MPDSKSDMLSCGIVGDRGIVIRECAMKSEMQESRKGEVKLVIMSFAVLVLFVGIDRWSVWVASISTASIIVQQRVVLSLYLLGSLRGATIGVP